MDEKAAALGVLADEIRSLTASPLYTYRTHHGYQPVIGEGDPDAHIVFIGEAPGKNEAETGRPFCGAAGRVLDELLQGIHIDRHDVYITNIVKDRPPNNRDPSAEELKIYSPFLTRQLSIIQPNVIATLGRFSMRFILDAFGLEHITQSISQLHGSLLEASAPWGTVHISPLFHPAASLYDRSKRALLQADMQTLADFVKKTHMTR